MGASTARRTGGYRRPWSLYTKEQVLAAIAGSYGIVSTVADRLDCAWHTARAYIDHWEETRRAIADEDERALDHTESKMREAIDAGDGPMIRFHLATKGKGRGYTERQELTGADGEPLTLQIVERLVGDDSNADD